jgi:N-hydroxyarylamine O-acetyltransferase
MNLNDYFKRIDYNGTTDITHDTLRDLHRAHLYAVPFENLNIHMPRPITLDESALFEKIVDEGRGGFCYEQNGLFAWALRTLGFDVQLLDARVYNTTTEAYGMVKAHLSLIVALDKRYLADVGFGSSFIEPLELDNPEIQTQSVGRFRVEHDGEWGTYFAQLNGSDALSPAYHFSMKPYQLRDFIEACDYTQTSPDSHFTQGRVCSLATPDGRITLTEGKFIRTALDGKRDETILNSEDEFHEILAEKFNIHVQTHPPNRVTDSK